MPQLRMKKYIFTIVALMLMFQLSTGLAQAGSSSGGSSGGGASLTGTTFQDTVTFTNNAGQTIEQHYWNDANGVGHQSETCTSCGSSGGGGFPTSICPPNFDGSSNCVTPPPPSPPPPSVCTITADKVVIGLGTTTIHLSWTPTPSSNVSLQRQAVGMKIAQNAIPNAAQQATVLLAGGGGSVTTQPATLQTVGKVLITPPSTAASFDDTVNVTTQATGGGVNTVISRKDDATHQQANIILAGGGGTTVNPGQVITPPVEKDGGTITYNLSYVVSGGGAQTAQASGSALAGTVILAGGGGSVTPPPVTVTCSVKVKVVAKLTECDDGIDNADPEDTLIDQQDPGCHTDGNPANPLSYDPNITSENNAPVDLIAHISAPKTSNEQKPLSVTSSEENISSIFATTNTLETGWRNTASVGTPSCGPSGSLCFTANGHSYIRMSSFAQAYLPHLLLTDAPHTFTPQSAGTYEVCAVADYYNVIQEGVAGEANNIACQTVQVVPNPPQCSDGIDNDGDKLIDAQDPGCHQGDDITQPYLPNKNSEVQVLTAASFTANPTRVKKGGSATLTWNTGNRTQCTITGTNGQSIDLSGAPSATSRPTTPITVETTYTMSCADDNTTLKTAVKLLPQYQEI